MPKLNKLTFLRISWRQLCRLLTSSWHTGVRSLLVSYRDSNVRPGELLQATVVITQQKDNSIFHWIILILAVGNSLNLYIFEFSQFQPDLIAPINFGSRRSYNDCNGDIILEMEGWRPNISAAVLGHPYHILVKLPCTDAFNVATLGGLVREVRRFLQPCHSINLVSPRRQ